jgi:RES domain-containing protein
MALDDLITSWSGIAYRHLPAQSPYSVLDFRFAGRSADNRWNDQGASTLYLAGDVGVIIDEFGRHFAQSRAQGLRSGVTARRVYRLDLALDGVLDLRDPQLWQVLSLQNAPYCFLDRSIARATANFLRSATSALALLVPSMAFLDQLDRWVLAVFLEKLPADVSQFVRSVDVEGPLRWGDTPNSPT